MWRTFSAVLLVEARASARSYLGARIYVHTTARTRDISIVPSSACRGNNSAGAHETRCVIPVSLSPRAQRKPGQGSILPSLSFLFSQRLVFFFSLGPVPTDQRVFNYPDKISRDRSAREDGGHLY